LFIWDFECSCDLEFSCDFEFMSDVPASYKFLFYLYIDDIGLL